MCEHKRIKSVNCVLSCVDCGEILPADFLTAGKGKNQANNPPIEEKPDKSPARKRTPKKG